MAGQPVAGAVPLRTASKLSVLVIDDDHDIREYLQDFLQGDGFGRGRGGFRGLGPSRYGIPEDPGEKDAEEKMKQWSKNVLEVQHGSNKSHTSKETIQRFYELISMFYVSFFRSKIYTEAFGFPDSSKITFNPIDLKRLIALYVIHPEGISATNYNDFRTEAIARLR